MDAKQHVIAAVMPDRESPLATHLFLMINAFETGGGERQFVTLVEQLRQNGIEPGLGCLSRTGPFAVNIGEVREFPLGGSFHNPRAARSGLDLIRHLRKQRVLLAQAFDFYTNLLLIPACRLARVPVVLGTHWQLGDLLTPMQFRAQLAVFQRSDCVVCNSHAAARTLTGRGLSQRKTAVIPNAIGEEFFSQVGARESGDHSRLRIGLIARMNSTKKGHRIFLRAAEKLAAYNQKVEFILAGDGPLRVEFEQLATELGLASRVSFVGDCQGIAALLDTLDLTVNASDSESQSNSILESMARGVPVVASNVGGTPEIVEPGRTGLLFAADDVEALSSAMGQLVTQPDFRRDCGERGRKFVESNFRAAKVTAMYSDLYERLLGEKGLA